MSSISKRGERIPEQQQATENGEVIIVPPTVSPDRARQILGEISTIAAAKAALNDESHKSPSKRDPDVTRQLADKIVDHRDYLQHVVDSAIEDSTEILTNGGEESIASSDNSQIAPSQGTNLSS
jgi:hypothetical protein